VWNKPQLMTAVSDLLLVAAAAALLVAAVVWSSRLPWFPLREVVVTHELREVRRSDVERSLSGRLRGNFFSINLDALRQSLEQMPWVRHAEVRRLWPSRIELSIEEHVPVAFWGQATGQLVNSYGEVFTATMNVPPIAPMPLLIGPTGLAPEMMGYYQEAEEILKPIGRTPRALNVSPRLALQLRLDDGMIVELGRQQSKAPVRQRLERFVEHYPSVLSAAKQRPAVVDMRYPNGFALRVNAPAAASATENKGKP
jgi:cell division protein FtsQ